jgi:5'(3')-deoxyribonucleotidase
MSVKVGDLVKWYELYADAIVKDVGNGVVIKKQDINYHDGMYENIIYDVYRFKCSDIHRFMDHNVELLENKNG